MDKIKASATKAHETAKRVKKVAKDIKKLVQKNPAPKHAVVKAEKASQHAGHKAHKHKHQRHAKDQSAVQIDDSVDDAFMTM